MGEFNHGRGVLASAAKFACGDHRLPFRASAES